MTTRHEFLEQLHDLLKPEVYLETGVQHGWSLQLSNAPNSIGIDPNPLLQVKLPHQKIFTGTSDEYFEKLSHFPDDTLRIDFAFIDGMHLVEYAARDFANITKYAHAKTVVVFDDVLPYTEEMASREICAGDWTGDVWKIFYYLRDSPELVLQLVDTTPTGTLVVTGFDISHSFVDPINRDPDYWLLENTKMEPGVLDRRHAWNPVHVLENLKDRGFAK